MVLLVFSYTSRDLSIFLFLALSLSLSTGVRSKVISAAGTIACHLAMTLSLTGKKALCGFPTNTHTQIEGVCLGMLPSAAADLCFISLTFKVHRAGSTQVLTFDLSSAGFGGEMFKAAQMETSSNCFILFPSVCLLVFVFTCNITFFPNQNAKSRGFLPVYGILNLYQIRGNTDFGWRRCKLRSAALM